MARWLLLSLLGGTLVTACVLPDVEVDPTLAEPVGSAGVGASGGISVPPSNVGGSDATDDDTDVIIDPLTPGAGGSETDDVNSGGSQGGSSSTGGTGAVGGSGGMGGSGGTSGAGGSAGSSNANPMGGLMPMLTDCSPDTSRETACTDYCSMFFAACEGFDDTDTYASLSDCISTCTLSLWPNGTVTTRESICCRWQHAKLANMGLSQNPHCYHSGEFPRLVPPDTGGCAALPTTP